MIYDRALTLCELINGGSLINGELKPLRVCLYSREKVYHKRYWEAVQANSRVDVMAALRRLPGEIISAHQYVILEDDHIYRIEQAQEEEDQDGMPIWLMSLKREETNYDIERIIPKA